MKNNIPFNSPKILGSEIQNIKKLSKYKHFSSGGLFTKRCSDWLIKNIKCKEALLVHSCTAALEMCAILLNIKKNDEIIMPSYTFVSTANAFVLRGGRPVFVDIDKQTLNINPKNIEKAISKKTKAIVVVHYAGLSCDMKQILSIAKKYKIFVVEDAAQAILSSYNEKPLGSIGDLATISFHETKNVHCGEGGALLINNPIFIKRARIIRDKGTNRDLFNKNLVKKYTWVDIGSSYGLSEINAAFLYAQLIQAKKITKYRKKIFNIYQKELKRLEGLNFLSRPFIPNYSNYNGHMYYIQILKNKRLKLIKYLKKKFINSVFHYIPLHSSPYIKEKKFSMFSLKNTNRTSNNILRLPIYYGISSKKVKMICKHILNFYNQSK
jgi:dTDP-4-amino-4,6-dideoxygalactose transaminase